jgi:hypothetical protein
MNALFNCKGTVLQKNSYFYNVLLRSTGRPHGIAYIESPPVGKIVAFKGVILKFLKMLANLSLDQIIISHTFAWDCPFNRYFQTKRYDDM